MHKTNTLVGYIRVCQHYIMTVSEIRRESREKERIFEKIMAPNFSNLIKILIDTFKKFSGFQERSTLEPILGTS